MVTIGSKYTRYKLLIYSPFDGFIDKGCYDSYYLAEEAGKSITRYPTGVSYKIEEVH